MDLQIMQPRIATAADGVAPTSFESLPQPLALRILALLPADSRLLAAAVCRVWRAALADPALWTRLDLTAESGLAKPYFVWSDALLCAAAARAGGQLAALRVSAQRFQAHDSLPAVLTANAATLRELTVCTEATDTPPTAETLAELLRAAPGLRLLEACVRCDAAEALPLLRQKAPWGPLRLKRLELHRLFTRGDSNWHKLADGLAAHTSLEVVMCAGSWPERAGADVLVGALLSLPHLRCLTLISCPSASALARLLGCAALKSLRVQCYAILEVDSANALSDALRTNTQLETLEVHNADFWHDIDFATALLATLQAHPSLRLLSLKENTVRPEHAAAAGAALGALITHSPTLTSLDISYCRLCDAGMGPIIEALPSARNLHTLNCARMSDAFVGERLLPAVAACAPLCTLLVEGGLAADEVQMLMKQRCTDVSGGGCWAAGWHAFAGRR